LKKFCEAIAHKNKGLRTDVEIGLINYKQSHNCIGKATTGLNLIKHLGALLSQVNGARQVSRRPIVFFENRMKSRVAKPSWHSPHMATSHLNVATGRFNLSENSDKLLFLRQQQRLCR
jgi:hypothetical protein